MNENKKVINEAIDKIGLGVNKQISHPFDDEKFFCLGLILGDYTMTIGFTHREIEEAIYSANIPKGYKDMVYAGYNSRPLIGHYMDINNFKYYKLAKQIFISCKSR